MPGVTVISGPLEEAERNARIYRGDILIFRDVAAMTSLVERVADWLVERFEADPESVHRRLPASLLDAEAADLRKDVARDPTARTLLHRALEEVGVAADRTYRDGLKLRVQPPRPTGDSPLLAPLGAHRDTWGSNLMAQTNWWAPVFPISAERTIALFPGYFRRPVPNDSAAWDLSELIARRTAGRPTRDYPLLPLASEAPPWEAAIPITLEPGDLLCFSGAQLHASVPNRTDRTRFSLEARTVNEADVLAGRGAPNVDGRAPRIAYHWFRRLSDGQRLGSLSDARVLADG